MDASGKARIQVDIFSAAEEHAHDEDLDWHNDPMEWVESIDADIKTYDKDVDGYIRQAARKAVGFRAPPASSS